MSHATIMVTRIEALLEGRALADVDSYEIAGRSMRKMAVPELLKWRNFYRAEVKAEARQALIAAEGTVQSLTVRL